MVPKLVDDHVTHVCLQVRFTIEILSPGKFLGCFMHDVVSVTVDSTVEPLFRLAYVLLATTSARN